MLFICLYLLLSNFLVGRFLGFLIGRRGFFLIIYINFLLIYLLLIVELFTIVISIPLISELQIFTWLCFNGLEINFSFLFDNLSVIMLTMVLLISGLVHYYSVEYMKEDPFLIKFLSYLSLFTSFMFILVCSSNFFVLFIGWEGVGLCSYLLISFWSTRVQAGKAALKALLLNRIGDFFLLIAICFILKHFRTIDFTSLFALVPYFTNVNILIAGIQIHLIEFVTFLLFLAVCGKSAQLGLHTWLPDAMEGPTPVSALIHAATMVTAGVFLLLRCSFLFCFSVITLKIVIYVGVCTTLVAGSIAIAQNDIKKIIAYSTCSQLGYMVLTCGLLNFSTSFFHLINHAFFKALLFLGAGAIIHFMSGEQDIRKMGGLIYFLPFYYCCFLIGSLSLLGFFFFSGFYSKELIINNLLTISIFHSNSAAILFTYWFSIMSVALTALYSFKLIYYVFYNPLNSLFSFFKNYNMSVSRIFLFVLVILLLLSIISGFFLQFFFKNSLFFVNSFYLSSSFDTSEFLPVYLKLIPFLMNVFSFTIIFCYFKQFNKFFIKYKFIYGFLNNKYFFDSLYNKIALNTLWYGTCLVRICDKGLLEVLGPKGLFFTISYLSRYINNIHLQVSFLQALYFMICNTLILTSIILLF